jgi:uroporphyrinogen decarboxylase
VSNLFLKACRREPVPRTPVWFMRQAGRYMPEYRALRAKHSLLELCKRPDLAAEITMQPVERLGVDAAILFADLLLPAEAMGMPVEFVKGEGPLIHRPLRDAAAVERLRGVECAADLGYVGEALRKIRAVLKPDVALAGFAGAPFTLASYMIEGGPSRDYAVTKTMMVSETPLWNRLMAKLVAVQSQFLKDQIAAGAQAVQVFDSWAGCLSPHDYEQYVLPHTRALISSLSDTPVSETPVIHFATGVTGFLEMLPETRASVISLDWRVDLGAAWDRLGPVAIQGNLDPVALLLPRAELRREVTRVLQGARGRAGHIFNLGHGILQQTPVENVRAVVEMVAEYSAKS